MKVDYIFDFASPNAYLAQDNNNIRRKHSSLPLSMFLGSSWYFQTNQQ